MKEIILAKYGEIALKGLNKHTFESTLVKNIRYRIKSAGDFKISRSQSIIYISSDDENADIDAAVEALQKVFGLSKVCRACVLEKDIKEIIKVAPEYLEDSLDCAKSFKVIAKRADKRFPMASPEITREVGGHLLEAFPHLKVDVHNPEVKVTVEIREQNAYIHADNLDGAGGMPVGTSGNSFVNAFRRNR